MGLDRLPEVKTLRRKIFALSAYGAPPITGSMVWGGAPFFVLTQSVNPGLIAVLRQSIVPRLMAEAPQPSVEALEADRLLSRFTLIFDREGYSPDFFAELQAQRIAILTYHKYPVDKWPAAEFARHSVRLHNGQIVELDLAERGTRLPNNLWVREVRRLNSSQTQTLILSTDMRLDLTRIAAEIAARWSQECKGSKGSAVDL